ncbi:TPA: glycoside hydrolase family 19 protein [Pseudomonas aeruginosa]|uniref:glycoside hydrolase family 19 protein n=2 Tax=Pseudomonas aeruginosa TaxID=287 RepID=UPI00065FBE8B|nr:glycoside hydrolase family 19 protein [Pseudomonas aeruginosa]ELK4757846.1 glycoside hydrolase family 19 protein [Pseudomonas aeruginosa]EMB4855972.1 glycoside hydrolase family 19 protein [Pseudomonas aeruginosa]MBH4203688.1 glycoside hydrolase family 19 protein [Pseudomonas aeruginosa]MBH4279931.1 glycoside hydrolase family 19 protein [Pseudomonas aeruginosa]TEM94290.1 glycoside hydrolase family 19 protein [Pseudomonas aeruginosa]
MLITEQQLLQIFPNAGHRAGFFVPALNVAMERFDITSPVRLAAFLAQVGHESSQLTRLVENLNYSARGLAATWPSRYRGTDDQPNALAQRLARNPRAIANNAYAARNGNGDEASGDGWRFRGRGLLQITGRANYRAAGGGLGQPLEAEPELLEQPDWAALSAAWWWSTHGLNELADRGEFAAITSRINGGLNGQAERLALWERAKRALS